MLSKILEKASKGRFGLEKAKNLKSVAKTKDAFSFQIKQLMEQIIFIESQIEDLETQISNQIKQLIYSQKLIK